MATPFLGEIKIMSFSFAPKGWALCNGQLMSIQQNQALFALLGTTYGGDGRVNFALPNMQNRVPLHFGNGFTQGELGGTDTVTLNVTQLPGHSHTPVANTAGATQTTAAGNLWCTGSVNQYSTAAPNTPMNPAAISSTGGSQAHNNLSPYLVLSFCIALSGIFPSRN
jgi:microcystin-dependent protein